MNKFATCYVKFSANFNANFQFLNLDSSSIEKRTYLVVGSFFRFKQFMDSNCSFLNIEKATQ